jgi:hypothetical protein
MEKVTLEKTKKERFGNRNVPASSIECVVKIIARSGADFECASISITNPINFF